MVAVNVSPRQFESDLADTFGGIIGRSGIDPATVCLEVTESMVMQDAELAIATLRELKSLGLSISVDDFGTGFSSLAYLKRFPLDELKIDKSFVDGLGHDFEATAIVAAVMGMAHALDLRVVAEGVETADQVVRLRTLGCDEAQGFFYARPGPAADIDARLIAEARAHVGGTHHAGRKHAESAHIGKILVVDDADDVRQLARSSLAAVGFEVREAASGEDAVTMARHFKPDCLVLDVNLPGISGFDVCRILRDDPANQRTTIVILTGDAGPTEKVMAFSLEADDYMVKPFSPRDLVSRVTAAIRRRGEMFASNPLVMAPQPSPLVTDHGGSALTIVAVLVSVVVTLALVAVFIATIGPVSRRFRIVRTSSPIASPQSSPGISLRDEVDELAQFLAAWQRVTVDRLSGRVEQSEVLDKGLLAHVAKLLGAERIVISLLDPADCASWTVIRTSRSRSSWATRRAAGPSTPGRSTSAISAPSRGVRTRSPIATRRTQVR